MLVRLGVPSIYPFLCVTVPAPAAALADWAVSQPVPSCHNALAPQGPSPLGAQPAMQTCTYSSHDNDDAGLFLAFCSYPGPNVRPSCPGMLSWGTPSQCLSAVPSIHHFCILTQQISDYLWLAAPHNGFFTMILFSYSFLPYSMNIHEVHLYVHMYYC